MLVRYSGSAGAGLLVTGALFYWMQLMIDGTGSTYPPYKPIRLAPPNLIVERPPQTPPRTPPPPPRPTVASPSDATFTALDPTTGPVEPVGPATPPGPPSPPTRPDGRSGQWIADGGLMLLARGAQIYPDAAIRRGIEGYVTVEFTVTRNGTVSDVRVIDSSDRVFEAAAVSTVARSRYQPQVVDGVAVDVEGVRTKVAFEFDD